MLGGGGGVGEGMARSKEEFESRSGAHAHVSDCLRLPERECAEKGCDECTRQACLRGGSRSRRSTHVPGQNESTRIQGRARSRSSIACARRSEAPPPAARERAGAFVSLLVDHDAYRRIRARGAGGGRPRHRDPRAWRAGVRTRRLLRRGWTREGATGDPELLRRGDRGERAAAGRCLRRESTRRRGLERNAVVLRRMLCVDPEQERRPGGLAASSALRARSGTTARRAGDVWAASASSIAREPIHSLAREG